MENSNKTTTPANAEQQNTPSSKLKKRRRARTYSTRKIVVVLMAILAFGGWYYMDRPGRLYRLARHLMNNDPTQAAILLEEAVGLSNGDFPAAQLLWTQALLRAGRWREAIGCFSLINEPGELDAEQLLNLGDEATAAGVSLLATNALEAVSPESAFFVPAAVRSIELKFEKNKWSAVIQSSEQLDRVAPSVVEPEIALMVAVSYEQLANYDKSLEAYRRYLNFDDADVLQNPETALRGLQRLSVAVGDTAESRMWLERLRQKTTFNAADRVSEAGLLRLEGHAEAASDIINDVLAGGERIVAAIQLRGILAMDRGAWAEAEEDFQYVLQAEPWNKLAHYKLAQALLRQGRQEDAERHFERNREINQISARILKLQSVQAVGAEETNRLAELAIAYDELGRSDIAEKLRLRNASLD